MNKPNFTLLHFPDAKQMTYEEAAGILSENCMDPESAWETHIELLQMLISYYSSFEEDFICMGITGKLIDLQAIINHLNELPQE